MKLYQKVKAIREDKKFSQTYIANELGLDQSQYSRREKGEVQFTPDEIIKLASLLGTSISNLFNEKQKLVNPESKTFKNALSISDKLIEQYELRLKERDEIIAKLQKKQ